jgi:hypothetical protein
MAKNSNSFTNFDVNSAYIFFYVLTMAINGVCVAYTTGGNNQTAGIFAAKMGWDAETTRRNNTIISTCS